MKTLIKDNIVYLDGQANKEADNVNYTYLMKLNQKISVDVYFLNVSVNTLKLLSS